jgi:galactose mutarotase-like enzyme
LRLARNGADFDKGGGVCHVARMDAEQASRDIVTLRAGAARAEIAPLGAEARRWRVAGQDLLWRPEPSVWPRVSPLLFPIVGWARGGRIRVGGESYPMGVHGFAADSLFRVEAQARDRVRLRLDDSAESRRIYPFRFSLAADYALTGDSLSVEIAVTNAGAAPMPYACGVHPGFCWPFGGGERPRHRIVFEAEEDPLTPEITAGGLFSDRRRAAPLRGRTLALDDALFAREALCWLDARSRALVFDNGAGRALRVAAQGLRHWALWSRPPARFLAIEAWTGHGDPEGYAGELADKPSMILLAPGARRVHRVAFSLSVSGPAGRR